MEYDAKKVASDWIAYARLGPDKASEAVFADGWELVDLTRDDPKIAWEALKIVIGNYAESEFYSYSKTEAQTVVGLTAAGPLEDILAHHGPSIIELAEIEARRDRRMAWALGGVWQCGMPEDIWVRVQRAADKSYWERPVVE